jgi:long-subunit acyl-CoA synthetase (AMP-forming)
MSLTLLTSGTTKAPKTVIHSWEYIESCIQKSIKEIGLTSNDIVLDVFPANTIAHYTITAMPAYRAGARLVSAKFEAASYIEKFKQTNPTYIALIPRHWELLKEVDEWNNLDMSSVRYMVTGSGPVSQEMINDFKSKGVQTVANWYGMTEQPPPVMIGYNTSSFDFDTIDSNTCHVMFTPVTATSSLAECIINGCSTGDIFDMATKTFSHRRTASTGNTWKTI